MSKLKILWKKKASSKAAKMSLKTNGTKRACIDKDVTWKWLVQSDLQVQTEATICAAQQQALSTNYTKTKIDKTSENPLCRMCGERRETVQHIIRECKK